MTSTSSSPRAGSSSTAPPPPPGGRSASTGTVNKVLRKLFTQREWSDDKEEVKDSIKQTVKDMSMADLHDTIETFKEDIDQQDKFSRYKSMVDRMKFMIDVAFEAFAAKGKLDKHPNQASMCVCLSN